VTSHAALVAWLEARRPAAPEGLAAHLAAAAQGSPASSAIPDALAATGLRLLDRVTAASPSGRELAMDLLAADAFITYAFEAQAEQDVDGLAQLAARVDQGEARA
jgi:hypothetical protein